MSTDHLFPVHTVTFSCVFVLFHVMSWLFSIPLRTVNNTKTKMKSFITIISLTSMACTKVSETTKQWHNKYFRDNTKDTPQLHVPLFRYPSK